MRLRTTRVVVLALAVAACGSSSHPSTTRSTQSASAASTPSTSSKASSAASAATGAAPATATGPTLTAPPPAPAGTPAAPDGLSQTVGYGTYELCTQNCSGAVPSSLRRPLHLPALGGSCPVRAGSGPVKPQGNPTQLAVSSFVGSAWLAGEVNWRASGYSGPILIRGRELGGPHAVGFGEGHVPYDELQLHGPAMGAPLGVWPSFTRVRKPGCYAYEVDGTSFSEVIVFRAT